MMLELILHLVDLDPDDLILVPVYGNLLIVLFHLLLLQDDSLHVHVPGFLQLDTGLCQLLSEFFDFTQV